MTKSLILQRISATIQFILGFLIGIGLIVGVSGALVFAYYSKMSTLPQKPVFTETPVSEKSSALESDTAIEPLESNTTTEESETARAEEAETEADPESELPPDAYYAVVTWSQGLSLRAEPDIESGRIGGIAFEEKIIILEDSADGKWQRVRIPWSQQ